MFTKDENMIFLIKKNMFILLWFVALKKAPLLQTTLELTKKPNKV